MRRYLIFFTAGLSLFMSAVDATVVAVAFPSFTRELHSTVLWSSWTISIFFIAVTMTLPVAGNLADNFGRKKLFLVSLLLFTGSSLACGLAPNIYALIAFRFFQGLGGTCFVPTASGIVSDYFPCLLEEGLPGDRLEERRIHQEVIESRTVEALGTWLNTLRVFSMHVLTGTGENAGHSTGRGDGCALLLKDRAIFKKT